jgi:hypothetical protein
MTERSLAAPPPIGSHQFRESRRDIRVDLHVVERDVASATIVSDRRNHTSPVAAVVDADELCLEAGQAGGDAPAVEALVDGRGEGARRLVIAV